MVAGVMDAVVVGVSLALVWVVSARLILRDAHSFRATGAARVVPPLLAALGPYGAGLYFFFLREWLAPSGPARRRRSGDELRRLPTIPDD